MSRIKNCQGMTLVEIMIVLAIIGIVVAITIPGWIRQRESSRGVACQENLTKIEYAKEMYAFEHKLTGDYELEMSDLWMEDGTGYLKFEPKCPAGGTYFVNPINTKPSCSYFRHELFAGAPTHESPW
ncbi:prepilin-type N-terminal cleavage/methylation domain-containing protein [Candidatus Sumerlaeota bacterium]|nr:prepilin-type N-terminal cleavage/methylation domain-containing protein [Candidatus Sumerlaeota bacterium]